MNSAESLDIMRDMVNRLANLTACEVEDLLQHAEVEDCRAIRALEAIQRNVDNIILLTNQI